MSIDLINSRGLVMVGCGNMGSALLKGWLKNGIELSSVTVIDPTPSEWLNKQASAGLILNKMPEQAPAVVVFAVKPYMIVEVIEQWKSDQFHQTVFLSIAAGANLSSFESMLSVKHPIVRSMPNTPVSVMEGAVAYIGNDAAKPYLPVIETLLSSVGLAVKLEVEAQIDAVTALSGSGPAYLFQMAESMVAAGQKLGLSEELALALAKQTILGAGKLMAQSEDSPEQLRIAVTSPKGTTHAALQILKDESTGLDPLLLKAMEAARDRSIELG
jgi:pyrroline-5-carboxylate reductase|tara:strand:+ start:5519 stop:6334 length:816 start_codon:yes stop_codon:yes gene_type:complete